MINILNFREVIQRIEKGAIVIDVMTPEDYAVCHVAGALNACVYEMVFLERIKEFVPSHDSEIILYDTTGKTRAAEVASKRLLQSGYSNVSILSGGLSAWRNAGMRVAPENNAVRNEPKLQDGTYLIDINKSMLEWIGRNFGKRHYGRIPVKTGDMVITGGILSQGNIILDMTSISDYDLKGSEWYDVLIRHLMSDDFFDVEQYPTAAFNVTKSVFDVKEISEAYHGTVTGNLTIKGLTHPVSFNASISPQSDCQLLAHAFLDIDRTLWGVNYGSSRLFERLGMHLVHDIISLELFIAADRV